MNGVEIINIHPSTDARGWVAWPITPELLVSGNLGNVHLPSLTPGAVRGNHYHSHAIEYVLILNGPCRSKCADHTTGETQDFAFTDNFPVLLKIDAGITHAFKNEGSNDIFLLCFEQQSPGSPVPDCIRHVILDG